MELYVCSNISDPVVWQAVAAVNGKRAPMRFLPDAIANQPARPGQPSQPG